MEFSAEMYGATWRFDQQGLPFDLEARCKMSNVPCLLFPTSLCGRVLGVRSMSTAAMLLPDNELWEALPQHQLGMITR